MKFNIERKCEKCGNEGRKLVDQDHTVVFRPAASTEYVPKVDKLLRTCKRCGYQWLEDCVDA